MLVSLMARKKTVARQSSLKVKMRLKAHLYHAGAEVGQGAHTVFKQFACEALDCQMRKLKRIIRHL